MGKEVRIFDLLTKKQSLTVFKSQKRKNKLAEELNKVITYQKQLLEIMQSIDKEASQKTVSELKSEISEIKSLLKTLANKTVS